MQSPIKEVRSSLKEVQSPLKDVRSLLEEVQYPLKDVSLPLEDIRYLLKDVRPSQEDERFLLNKPRRKLRCPTRTTRSTIPGFPKKEGNPPSLLPSSCVSQLDAACIQSKPVLQPVGRSSNKSIK